MENEYISAIKKLDELEDAEIYYHLANHFRSKADCIKAYDEFAKIIQGHKITIEDLPRHTFSLPDNKE